MNLDSPTSPMKTITQRITLSPERTISPINNADGSSFTSSNNTGNSKENSPSKKTNHSPSSRITPPKDAENQSKSPNHNTVLCEKNGNSPSLQSFNAVLESLSPQREKKVSFI